MKFTDHILFINVPFGNFFSYQLDGRIFICVKIYGLNFFPTAYALNATDSITFTCAATSHIQLTFCNNQNMHVKIL